MTECQMITHEIVRGDTLYRLAQRYKTTVPLILLANPEVDPYNLQVGTKLNICRGNRFTEKPSMDEIQMTGDFGKAFMQYAGWIKMYLMSLSGSAMRQREAALRTEQAADRVVDLFALFYPESVITSLRDLFVKKYTLELLSYANATNNRDTDAQKQFAERVTEHAENIAALLARYNRFYDKDRLEEELKEPLEVADRIVTSMRADDMEAEFSGFDRLDEWAASLATYLSDGLRREFYRER